MHAAAVRFRPKCCSTSKDNSLPILAGLWPGWPVGSIWCRSCPWLERSSVRALIKRLAKETDTSTLFTHKGNQLSFFAIVRREPALRLFNRCVGQFCLPVHGVIDHANGSHLVTAIQTFLRRCFRSHGSFIYVGHDFVTRRSDFYQSPSTCVKPDQATSDSR